MPMAALIARRDLDIAPDAALGHYTHEKSPVGSAAALATLDVIRDEGLIERARELGRRGLARLNDMRGRHAFLGEARRLGCYFGLEVRGPDPLPAAERAEAILYAALERGLSFKIGGGNVITLCRRSRSPGDQFDRAFDILEAAIAATA